MSKLKDSKNPQEKLQEKLQEEEQAIKPGMYNVVVKMGIPDPENPSTIVNKNVVAAQVAVFRSGVTVVQNMIPYNSQTTWPHFGMFYEAQGGGKGKFDLVDLDGNPALCKKSEIVVPDKKLVLPR